MLLVAADPRGGDPFVWPRLTAVALPGALAVVGALALARRLPLRQRAGLALAALVPVAGRPGPAVLARRDRARGAVDVVAGLGRRDRVGGRPGPGAPVAVGRGGAGRGAGRRRPVGVGARRGGRRPARVRARARRRRSRRLSRPRRPPSSPRTRASTPRSSPGARRRISSACARCRGSSTTRCASGRTVLAGPTARTALELWGFRFTTRARVAAPAAFSLAAVTGRLHCVPVAQPWRELPGLEYTGRLGLHVPAGTGQLEIVIVGPPPLSPRLTLGRRAASRAVGAAGDGPAEPAAGAVARRRATAGPRAGGRCASSCRRGRSWRSRSSLALGQRAPLVAVRFTEPAHLTGVATVCAAPLPREAADVAERVPLDDAAYFGGGWHPLERDGHGAVPLDGAPGGHAAAGVGRRRGDAGDGGAPGRTRDR